MAEIASKYEGRRGEIGRGGEIEMREVRLLQASRAVNRRELAGLLNGEMRNAKFTNLDEQGDDERNRG